MWKINEQKRFLIEYPFLALNKSFKIEYSLLVETDLEKLKLIVFSNFDTLQENKVHVDIFL